MKTESQMAARMAETHRRIESVFSRGLPTAVDWLISAYHAHESELDSMTRDYGELACLYLANVSRPLTIREAQLLGVCRVCRGPYRPEESFVLSFGQEYAHQSCLTGQ